jgi:hypothetical protein
VRDTSEHLEAVRAYNIALEVARRRLADAGIAMLHTYSVGVVIGPRFAGRRIVRYPVERRGSAPGSEKRST